jgi:hypothetical protein
MDANGQRFWLLRDADAFMRPKAPLPPAARFDTARNVLRLASEGLLDLPRPPLWGRPGPATRSAPSRPSLRMAGR